MQVRLWMLWLVFTTDHWAGLHARGPGDVPTVTPLRVCCGMLKMGFSSACLLVCRWCTCLNVQWDDAPSLRRWQEGRPHILGAGMELGRREEDAHVFQLWACRLLPLHRPAGTAAVCSEQHSRDSQPLQFTSASALAHRAAVGLSATNNCRQQFACSTCRTASLS